MKSDSAVLPRWYLHAQTFERAGILEIPGPKAHPTIVSFFEYTSYKAKSDEIAWCSAFACAVMEQCAVKSTKSAAARSWLDWGVPLKTPLVGCIVVFDRKDKTNPTAAHVAFYTSSDDPDHIEVLGGNQSNKVCFATYKKKDVLGYRWPIGEPQL